MKILFTLFFAWLAWFGLRSDDSSAPEWNRFTEEILAEGLDEPMEMAFLPGNKVIIVERKGGVKIIDESSKDVFDAGFITVNTKYTNKEGNTREAEEGLMGVSIDPNFDKNNWVYLYYAHPAKSIHVLSRFELKDDVLDMASEKVVLEVVTQREECCHTGGGMVWDKSGNLFLTVGNNTVNPRQGSSNLVELPGHENEDDQRAPGNTNDLRGKILRIHPENDGSYTIPEGNLFPKGTPKTRPEIYTMGHRNAWRPTLDSKTGYLYWGEVGPDAAKDSIWGPKGYDEFNQAKGPGFFGWPYFIADNRPYNQYNSADGTYGEPFDVNKPQNKSVNNTGLVDLPKPTKAMIYYPYGPSDKFPQVGSSGRSATGGPVYRKADFEGSSRPWPAYYEGKWLITDFMRGWIFAVSMDENGEYESMERVLPNMNYSSAIDMDFGPTGDLYVLEYGSAWFRGNENSKLVRIQYNAGNRKPIVKSTVSKTSGKLPLTVNFSSEGSNDFDNDELTFDWSIVNDRKKVVAKLKGADGSYTFNKAGNYQITLEVSDDNGGKNSMSIPITAGNAAAEIDLSLKAENQTFYFDNQPVSYNVNVKDEEDGSTPNSIKPEEVAVTFDFIPAGFDPIEIAAKHKSADDMASFAVGRNLIETSDCKSCHQYEIASIGPSYKAVAEKYPNTPTNMDYLTKKIIGGGSGVWGEHGMSAHPDLSEINAKRMVEFIFSMNGKSANVSGLPLAGKVSPETPDYEDEGGSFVLRAAYHDKGGSKTDAILSESKLVLRSNYLNPEDLDGHSGAQILTTPRYSFMLTGDKSYVFYNDIDLSGIKELVAYVQVSGRAGALGGNVELRLGSPSGELIAASEYIGLKELGWGRPPAGMSIADFNRSRSSKAQLKISKPIKGRKDVYLVFRNDQAKSTDVLMQLVQVGFMK